MKYRDKQAFDDWKANQKNDDGTPESYGLACFTYAERWATMMEAEMESKPDADFGELAKRLSHTADEEGVTGFMYGMAVSILAKCWVNGELLRRLHCDLHEKDQGPCGGMLAKRGETAWACDAHAGQVA